MTYTETVNCSFTSQTKSCFAQEACVFRLSINMSNGWIFFKEKEKLKCGRAKHCIHFCVPWHDGDDLFFSHTRVLGVSVYKDHPCPNLQDSVTANQRTYTARGLRSGTDYLVTVIAQYPNSVGDSVSAKQRTSEYKVNDSTETQETDKTLMNVKVSLGKLPNPSCL